MIVVMYSFSATFFDSALAMSDRNFSLTTFSSSGKLGQIEHALSCVAQGKICIGVKTKTGVVLVTEKRSISPLVDEASLRKIENITQHIGVVYSGMPADYRVLLRQARVKAMEYYSTYLTPIPVLQAVKDIASLMQKYTQSGGVRPFGVSLLVAGVDHKGPQLYQVDPSGAFFGWKATSVGKGFANAKNFLEKRWKADIEIEDAIQVALLTLKENFEGNLNVNNLEIGVARVDAIGGEIRARSGAAEGEMEVDSEGTQTELKYAFSDFSILPSDQVADYLSEVQRQ